MDESRVASDAQRLLEGLRPMPEPVSRPSLVALSGLPGTGKSYFSRRLAERLPFLIVASDSLRRVLFPRPTYSLEESARLFQTVHYLIEELLNKGIPIIFDATNLLERFREPLYGIAGRTGAKLILVWIEAPSSVVYERIKDRPGSRNTSEADWPVYVKMRAAAQKIRRRHYVVDTSKDFSPILDKIVREVRK